MALWPLLASVCPIDREENSMQAIPIKKTKNNGLVWCVWVQVRGVFTVCIVGGVYRCGIAKREPYFIEMRLGLHGKNTALAQEGASCAASKATLGSIYLVCCHLYIQHVRYILCIVINLS